MLTVRWRFVSNKAREKGGRYKVYSGLEGGKREKITLNEN